MRYKLNKDSYTRVVVNKNGDFDRMLAEKARNELMCLISALDFRILSLYKKTKKRDAQLIFYIKKQTAYKVRYNALSRLLGRPQDVFRSPKTGKEY